MKLTWLNRFAAKAADILHLSTSRMTDDDVANRGDRLIHKDTSIRVLEAYRMARTNLLYAVKGPGSRVFGVTSGAPHDGKSLTAANLAISFAMSGKRVLLIDCDMHRPSQGIAFNQKQDGGLSEYLAGVTESVSVITTEYENLSLLTAGRCPPNPAELLYGDRFSSMIERFKGEYECIFIDLPPLNVISDAAIVAPVLDGYVFVVRAGKSDRNLVQNAIDTITQVEGKILGFVLNDVGRKSLLYRADGYYGHYYNSYERRPEEVNEENDKKSEEKEKKATSKGDSAKRKKK